MTLQNVCKQLQYLFAAVSALLLASPAWAQTGNGGGAATYIPLGAGIGMGLASEPRSARGHPVFLRAGPRVH